MVAIPPLVFRLFFFFFYKTLKHCYNHLALGYYRTLFARVLPDLSGSSSFLAQLLHPFSSDFHENFSFIKVISEPFLPELQPLISNVNLVAATLLFSAGFH